jgi:DNA polymerase-3 subunit epsilon
LEKLHTKFENKSSRYVVISTETSGLSPVKDVIFSIAFAVVDNEILLAIVFETNILQYKYFHDNGIINDFVVESTRMKKNGLKAETIESL